MKRTARSAAVHDVAEPRAVIVHLSGRRRGVTEYPPGETLRIGTLGEAEILLPPLETSPVAPLHATLQRSNGSFELRAEPGRQVWVNGEQIERRVLRSGDVMEIGLDGPVLRFRLHPSGRGRHKRVHESLRDCYDCARHDGAGAVAKARIFAGGMLRELATQTSRWFRVAVAILLLGLVVTTVFLALRSLRLERRLQSEASRWSGIERVVAGNQADDLSRADLDRLRAELGGDLSEARDRLGALEERAGASRRVIADAARSVVLLQGAYGFEAADGRALRFAVAPDGRPLIDRDGSPTATLEGEGPPVERLYTGTAFVASATGLLLTNRHVALPWEDDEAAKFMVAQGLRPVMRRFVGFLPGSERAFPVELVGASDTADIALLKCGVETEGIPWLEFSERLPEAGEEVVVLGYPTGIRALLARTDRTFMDELMSEDGLDFWQVAERLAAAGRIAPLATRGIVGQVAGGTIVYDAPTTHGGSGGPVLGLDGRVVAVNAAVVPEFGGSNMGVAAAEASRLLKRTAW